MPSVSGPRSTLSVASAAHHGAVVVRLSGDLDADTVHLLHEEFGQVWASPGVSVLVIDVAEVTFCDSRGLGELITALQRCQADKIRLMLAGAQGVLYRVLTITGLRKVFEQHATVADALRSAGVDVPGDSGGDLGGLCEVAGDR
jgi:anti-anti-sigma factor